MESYLFKNKGYQDILDEQGYIKIPFPIPLVILNEIELLFNNFDSTNKGKYFNNFISGGMHDKPKVKLEISKSIISLLKPFLDNYFTNYEPFSSSFVYKREYYKEKSNELNPHQDWTFVDENHFSSYSIWIPLQDTYKRNGAMTVFPKTHNKYFKSLRSPTLPFYYQKFESYIKKNMQPIEVMRDEALVFNHSLIHGSLPNITNSIRKAFIIALKPKGIEVQFYYREDDKLFVYSTPDNFSLMYKNYAIEAFQKPLNECLLLETIFKDYTISLSEFKQTLNLNISFDKIFSQVFNLIR